MSLAEVVAATVTVFLASVTVVPYLMEAAGAGLCHKSCGRRRSALPAP